MTFRKICFRGKDAFSGEWRYGAYIPTDFTQWREPSISDGHHRNEVDPKTLGQYTGYKDVDGKEIYEGDILSFSAFEKSWAVVRRRGLVVFEAGGWEIRESMDRLFEGRFAYSLFGVLDQDGTAKVIGNIYENSDMLEGK